VSALIVWITKTVARWWFGGDTDRASGFVAWGFTFVTVVATGLLVHSFDSARCRAAAADIRATAATVAANQARDTLTTEREGAANLATRNDDYDQQSRQRESAAVEGAGLSARLDGAIERLRDVGNPAFAPVGVPATRPVVDSCANLRAARDRALAALELLKSAGDQVALDGQYAVDVASAAHADALAREGY
jgi:hypothetical protein